MTELHLHRYQNRAVGFALGYERSYMMVDIGYGKTAIALRTIKHSGCKAIVFAPLRVALVTWPEEIRKWVPDLSYTVLHGPKKDYLVHNKVDIFIVSYSSIKWFAQQYSKGIFREKGYFLVLDEASMVRDASTQRFKMLAKLLRLFPKYRMALSASPTPNGYHELWSQYYLLDDGERLGKTNNKFLGTYFNLTGPPFYEKSVRLEKVDELFDKIEDITFRLDNSEYIELPGITYNRIPVQLPQKKMSEYRNLERTFVLQLGEAEIPAFSSASLSMKLRQFIQGAMYHDGPNGKRVYSIIHTAKAAALRELMELHRHQPILCAVQFRFEYKMICDELGYKPPVIDGSTNDRQSIEYIEEWNRGETQLLVCHPASIAHGINLQTGGHIIVWYGLPWSLEHYEQLNGRVYRQGQKEKVTIHHLVGQDTIDEDILIALSKKHVSQRKLLDAILARQAKYDNN